MEEETHANQKLSVDRIKRGILDETPPGDASGDDPPPGHDTPSDSNVPPAVWTDPDRPTNWAGDLLDYKHIAEALVETIMDDRTSKPLIIAINAPWGTGKSTVANCIKDILLPREPCGRGDPIVAHFNAWEHDEDGALDKAFIRFVARTADAHRMPVSRMWDPLPGTALDQGGRRRRRIQLTTFGGGLFVLTAAASLPFVLDQTWLQGILAGRLPAWSGAVLPGGATAALPSAVARFRAAAPVKDYLDAPDRGASLGSRPEVRRRLAGYLDGATRIGRFGERRRSRRLMVLFIDDLERCRPPNAVDLLESLRLLDGADGVVVILLADMATLAASVDIKYGAVARHDQARSGGSHEVVFRRAVNPNHDFFLRDPDWTEDRTHVTGSFGFRYIQKFVQMQVDLAPVSRRDLRNLVEKRRPEATA